MKTSHHPSDELLVDLAMQLTTSEDAGHVLDHIKACPDCEVRFRELAACWEHAAVHAADLTRSPAAERQSVWARLRRAFSAPAVRWTAGAAAAAVLAFLFVPRLFDPAPELTTMPALTPDVLQRAALPTADHQRMMDGINAYGRGDYETAIASLSAVNTTGPIDALRRVYLANALAWSDRHDDAIATLEDVPLDVIPDPWSAEARWTLYISLVETAQLERARTVLENLAESPGEPGDRARALLETTPGR